MAQASILLHESRDGYPDHLFYARGHMAEAEAELALLYPDHSKLVRTERKLLENDEDYTPDFTGLMKKIDEDCKVCELMGNPRSIALAPGSETDLVDPSGARNLCEAKVERCVLALKDDPHVRNPYAVCRASIKC